MPAFSAKLYEIMNINYDENQSALLGTINSFISSNSETAYMFLLKLSLVTASNEIKDPLPLFKKISEEEISELKNIYG
jgi:hypothetical protein